MLKISFWKSEHPALVHYLNEKPGQCTRLGTVDTRLYLTDARQPSYCDLFIGVGP